VISSLKGSKKNFDIIITDRIGEFLKQNRKCVKQFYSKDEKNVIAWSEIIKCLPILMPVSDA